MSDAATAKKALTQAPKELPQTLGLHTGSTLLNLACTGNASYGFLTGGYYYLVGDSMSGKTFLTLTCLAEAARNKAFDNYRFILNDVEGGAIMDIANFFGQRVADRLERERSESIEDFYYHLDDSVKNGPCIYILDSMDALSSKAEGNKFEKDKKAYRRLAAATTPEEKEEKVKGSYGDGKAKINSGHIRQIIPKLLRSGSILIVISQTRDNIGMYGPAKTRSGGRALRFYATLEIWSSLDKVIERKALGKDRDVGRWVKLEVKKNRVTGRIPDVYVPIYHSLGIDDIGSCINFLVDEGVWACQKGVITAPEFDFAGYENKLARKIEHDGSELDLRELVQDRWDAIEAALDMKRKPRYE